MTLIPDEIQVKQKTFSKGFTASSSLLAGEIIDLDVNGEVIKTGLQKVAAQSVSYAQAEVVGDRRIDFSNYSASNRKIRVNSDWWCASGPSSLLFFKLDGTSFVVTVPTIASVKDNVERINDNTVVYVTVATASSSLVLSKAVIDFTTQSVTVTSTPSQSHSVSGTPLVGVSADPSGSGLCAVNIYSPSGYNYLYLCNTNSMTWVAGSNNVSTAYQSFFALTSATTGIMAWDQNGGGAWQWAGITYSPTAIAISSYTALASPMSTTKVSVIRVSDIKAILIMTGDSYGAYLKHYVFNYAGGTWTITSTSSAADTYGSLSNVENNKCAGLSLDANGYIHDKMMLNSLGATAITSVAKCTNFPVDRVAPDAACDITFMIDGFIQYISQSQSYFTADDSSCAPQTLLTHYHRVQCGMPAATNSYPFPYGAKRLPSTSLFVGAYRDYSTTNPLTRVYVSPFKQKEDIGGDVSLGAIAEYKVAEYDATRGLVLYTTDGAAAKIRAFGVTATSVTLGAEVTVDIINDRRHFSVVNNMAFYERSPGGIENIMVRPFTVAANLVTMGAELSIGATVRVYPGRHGYKIVAADATNNLFLYVNNANGYVKCVKTDGATTNSYDVKAVASVKVSGCKLDTDKFVVGSSTTARVVSLQLSSGTANLGSELTISNAVLQTIIPVSTTRFIVCYTNLTASDKYGVGKIRPSSFAGHTLSSPMTDGDVGGYVRVKHAASDTAGLQAKIWYSDDSIWYCPSPSDSSGFAGNIAARITAHPAVSKLITAKTQVGSGSGNDSNGYSSTGIFPMQSFITKMQVVDVDWDTNTMTLGNVQSLNNMQVADGGVVSPGLYWIQDTYGNYIEGSLTEIARSEIGIARADCAAGATANTKVFGAYVEGGYGNLTPGKSLVNGDGEEFAYALSATEVTILEA